MNAADQNLGLRDRVVLVTGAGRGLGRAYARALAAQGAQVAVQDAGLDQDGRNPDLACAEEVVAQIGAEGGRAFALGGVLGDAATCRTVVETVLERCGRLDGLIHNAGLVLWHDPATVDEEVYTRLSGVANEAAFWLCSAVLPTMRSQGFGRIVLTTSGWAMTPSKGSDELVLYCHGKGAQFGLAMALAKGAGHPDILTNLIAPVANTRIYRAEVPAGSLRSERVAGAVAWLASPACHLTGCLVRARDGDLTLARMTDGKTQSLGEAAADPATAGQVLTELAAAEGQF